MNENKRFPFPVDKIELNGSFFVDRTYTQKHAHTLHSHKDVVELLYVYSGEGRYQVGGREYAVAAGDMIICNAEVLHGETLALENTIQTYCIALKGLRVPGLPDNHLVSAEKRPIVTLGRFREMIHTIMPNIYDMFLLKEKEMSLPLSISVLIMTYQELQLQVHDSRHELMQRNETMVRQITEYLDANYTQELRMEDICKTFHLSRSYLSALFKRETGLSPKQYIILRRIGEAQSRLTESTIPIGQIEEELGFTSNCHFSTTFKKYVGISPREYRKHFLDSDT